MSLRDRIFNLTSPEDVESFLGQHPTSVIFKAGTCHKTMQGFGFLQERLQDRDDLMVGVIRVVEARPASNLVAERTNIVHQSPQMILFRDGEAVFDADNWSITPDALEAGFQHVPHTPTGGAVGQVQAQSDLTPYKRLLEQYLSGEMSDQEFEYTYTTLFRDDASLRAKDEVEVLNSIFGDVDKHMEMHMMMGGRTTNHSAVRERAESAYERLQQL
jgi:bacillithiol system protein YtxJ